MLLSVDRVMTRPLERAIPAAAMSDGSNEHRMSFDSFLRDSFYVPKVPRTKITRMAIMRLSLFQITTVRQAQITSHSIY